jgi:hypothetical protein
MDRRNLLDLLPMEILGPPPALSAAASWPALKSQDGGGRLLRPVQDLGWRGIDVAPGVRAGRPGVGESVAGHGEGIRSPANRGGPVSRASRQ